MNIMKKFIPFLMFLLAFSIHAKSQEYSFKETFDVKAPAQLSIVTSDGDINVQSSDQQNIKVRFIAKRRGELLHIDKEELLEYYTLEISQHSNSLEIVAKPKYQNSLLDWDRQLVLSFDVEVPYLTACEIKTSDGDIHINGLEGTQTCKASDGDINLHDIKGATNAITSDGDISLADIVGAAEATTSDGDIKITACKGDVKAKASDGDIKLSDIGGLVYSRTSDGNIGLYNIKGEVTGITSDGNIRMEMEKIDHLVDLRTSDGGITLTVPEESSFDLEMRGENLNVDFKNFSGDRSKHSIHGEVNGGGELVKLVTSDGRIKLNFE